jgi:pilus assembly protein FimV
MALGFGFNKAKVLAQAEKFVQQGKLPSAITEYEKIIKEDPKDLTVLNTVGDLYAKTGNNEQATYYFKRVGDQYAQNGFTVKAIAIYKKLTKIGSYNIENMTKLAELYSQQGLFNDARVHYMQAADHLLKAGDHNQAARIFQKILELDPENAGAQAKLADLYQKLGKKDEARNIYFTAAESLYARGSYEAATEALERVLALDASNAAALMLRGMIAVEAGDSQAAVGYLEKVGDLDSRPDGLRALLRAKLQTGNAEGVEAVANKLLEAHKDITGITTVAQWYATNNQLENALRLYEAHADRLFAGNQELLRETLYPLMGRARDNPATLAILNRLLNQAGDHSQTAEMIELQAHAAAKQGNFPEARDLYKKLMEMEPENVLHVQNHRQMLVKLGEDSATRILTPEEAAQAFMVEELDESAPSVHQSYDPPTEKAIESALTDAELYVSYNVPSKAIPPLEAALPLAPHDVNLNQRLAGLYVRSERFADAARLYKNLSDIYKELGHEAESAKYLEASRRYALRAPQTPAMAATPAAAAPAKPTWPPQPVSEPAPEPAAQAPIEIGVEAEPSVQEFTFDAPDLMAAPEPVTAIPVEPANEAGPMVAELSGITAEPVRIEAAPAAMPPPPQAHEIDISNEWEEMMEVEPAETAPELAAEPVAQSVEETPVRLSGVELEPSAAAQADLGSQITGSQVADKIQEIRFYIDQEMWEAAKSAILDLTELAPDEPEVTELIAAVSAGQSKGGQTAAAQREATPVFLAEPAIEQPAEEIPVLIEPPIQFEAPLPVEPLPAHAVSMQEEAAAPVPIQEVRLEPPPVSIVPPPVEVAQAPAPAPIVEPPAPVLHPPAVSQQRHAPEPVSASALDDLLEIAEPPAKPVSPAPAVRAKAQSTEDILGDFVLDLEQSEELKDFVPKQPAEPPHTQLSAPAAAPGRGPSAAAAPAMDRHSNGEMQDSEAADVLNDILAELQEETAEAAEPEEDPETHYNLGIAFKEMGLLDEAIGELQKVCHAVDRGASFSQPIQALTWLAQCLVDKGAPEAAVRWYQKALQLPGLDNSSRCAIYYDLAAAYEASGDNKSALAHFMEVYGSNIDFRDVASRIKALKS